MSEIRFDGRVAVITGAGGGLGKTYAKMFAARGASVVVNDLGGSSDGTGGGSSMADETVKEIEEAGGKAVANYDSVATPEGGEAIIQTAVDNFGKVDIVVNNAGILRDKSFTKLEPENLEIVLDVHLKGAFYVSQPAFRIMKENNYGRFVFTASGAGIFGNFGQSNYGAAKCGLVGLSNVLAVEGARNNIKCNVIAPIARTRLTEQLLGGMAEHLDPEFVTPLVTYLCSEACDLTHEIFDVGAGRYARIFFGMAPGWTAPKDHKVVAEDIAANLDQIRNTDGFTIPESIAGEMQAVMEALKARGSAMPIDPSKALGAELGESQTSYTKDQVILYHLGLGAGNPATDPNELEYTYEKNLKVLPSFGVIPTFGSMGGLGSVPGLEFNFAMLLHGEQDLQIHQPIPPEATITNKSKIAEIWDKGKAALVVLQVDTTDEAGKPLFTNRFSLFLRGEGGFGGEPGPKAGNAAPDRAPDGEIEVPSLPQQALIYRLSGDKNPLHADPEFAKMGGFDKPIIHGLCSYGVVCKAVVDHALGGDVTKVARYSARFAGVGFPGETYVVSYWKEGDKILIAAKSKERDAKIISNACIEVRS